MKRHLFKALFLGALVLSSGTFVSCSDSNDDLESRVTTLEGYVNEIQEQLKKALVTGASVVDVKKDDNGSWTLKLSDNTEIVIAGGTGGSNISVVVTDSNAIITVDGTEYVLPLGSMVNSLIFSPETSDGIVEIGHNGATVNFLARPALKNLDGATFTIAESHVMSRAGDGEQFKVNGEVTIEGDFIKVPIKALDVEAGKMYAVSLQLDLKGTVIGSNYFNVKISDDFTSVLEELGGVEIKSEYSPQDLADGFKSLTVKGSTLLNDFNFKTFFTTLPDNAQFVIASASKQPVGKAQEKVALLKNSLNSDGTWIFSERPGTSFNDNTDRPGFLVNVVANDVIKAKIYVVINDELANVDFTTNGLSGIFEAEWGGREKAMPLGAQTLNFPKAITNYLTDMPIIHNGKDGFFAKWADYSISNTAGDVLIFNNGTTLEMGDLAKAYAKKSRGIYYFFRGFAIYVPESLGNENGKYIDINGKEWSAGEGYGYDYWMGQYNDYASNPTSFYSNIASWNFTMDEKTGDLKFPSTYTGYGLRVAFDGGYEYAYGVKPLHAKGQDQMGMLFINRRVAPQGATMPTPKAN